MGSVLLVAVTVLMVGGLSLALASRPGPIETRHADLGVTIAQGSGDWGTGDERIEIRHRGGEPFFPDRTRIEYEIAGAEFALTGADLGSAFTDGVFQIGETWTRTVTIAVGVEVEVGVVSVDRASESLVSTNLLSAACNGDLSAPYVQAWTQAPADVKSSSTGSVTVTALVADACSGVDQASTPSLFYRINDGTNPAYTNAGVMTLTGTSTWRGTVPEPVPTWSGQVGKTLEYYIGPIKDVRNNAGNSATNADLVQTDCGSDNQPPTVQTWTQSPADVTGSTTGTVTVTAVLQDNCAGVDNGANPELFFRLNDGSNPSFTNAGPMSRTGTNTWQKSIPDQTWANHIGKTLEYELRLMKDLNGNSGTSTRQSDVIASSCASDTQAPTVQTWTQSPTDVTTGTVGAITITALLQDNCAGVDQAANPELHYRLNDGTNPAFTNGGAMTLTSPSTWQKTIPDQGWASQGGLTLEYELRLMKDLNGNSGTSTTQSDAIQAVSVYTYVNSNTPTTGTVASFGNAQSAADADAVATVAEGNVAGGASTNTYNADAVVSGGTWTNGNNGFTSNDVYATATGQDAVIEYSLANEAGSLGSITAVILKAEVSISPYTNDQFALQACLFGGTCNALSSSLSGSGTDVTIQYDVSALRPGGGSWSWTDINNLQGRVQSVKVGAFDGTWRIDRVWAEVTHSAAPAYSTSVRMDFAGVPSGTTQVLELRYRTTGDTFNLQVWDGSVYRTCTGTLNSAALATFSCSLVLPSEYQSGSPRIRFTDNTAGGATQGNLFLEYMRVKTN